MWLDQLRQFWVLGLLQFSLYRPVGQRLGEGINEESIKCNNLYPFPSPSPIFFNELVVLYWIQSDIRPRMRPQLSWADSSKPFSGFQNHQPWNHSAIPFSTRDPIWGQIYPFMEGRIQRAVLSILFSGGNGSVGFHKLPFVSPCILTTAWNC